MGLVFWSFGLLAFVLFFLLILWYFGLFVFWSFSLLPFGLLVFWSFAIWSFGLLVFLSFGLRSFDRWSSVFVGLLVFRSNAVAAHAGKAICAGGLGANLLRSTPVPPAGILETGDTMS